ncbi:MAG: hypothetical protein H6704_06060 [Myxococcales bacterium]|nr:hypothetical protein [Myxococcales bacterium]MCB9535811.1 hypothetical protein [Myxococcales bacterium]
MSDVIDPEDVVAQGTANGLARPVRDALGDDLPEAARELLLRGLITHLPETERPPEPETERGVYRKLDGSGWRVLRKKDLDGFGAMRAAILGALAAFGGNYVGVTSQVVSLGVVLFTLGKRGVHVDWYEGAVLSVLPERSVLEEGGEGLRVDDIQALLPEQWAMDQAQINEVLHGLAVFDPPLTVRVADRWFRHVDDD